MKGGNGIGKVFELFGSLAETRLCLKVFLEVVFAELIVELKHIIEVFHEILIVLPKFRRVLGGHGIGFFPLGLELAESIIVFVCIFGRA